MIKTLTCTDCRVAFTYDHRKGPTRQRCDDCRARRKTLVDAAKARNWRDANRERAREHWNRHNRKRLADPEHRRRKREDAARRLYGVSPEQMQAMRDAHGDLCAICKREHVGSGKRLHIDHDHVTGKVRGLLCGRCNTMIGLAEDDLDRLRAAAAYIRRHRKAALDG